MTWIKQLQEINEKGYYSQTSEDKNLDFIFKNLKFENKFVVELGAGDGVTYSNCKHLIDTYNLKAIRLEGKEHEGISKEWITKDNINQLLKKYKCPKIFDLLSIDLDGNDYWILKELLTNYIPLVVILEVNGTLEPDITIIMPYNAEHTWGNNNYYGASFKAFVDLMKSFNYVLIRNLNELNLIFVHTSRLTIEDKSYLEQLQIKGTKYIYHPIKQDAEWLVFQ